MESPVSVGVNPFDVPENCRSNVPDGDAVLLPAAFVSQRKVWFSGKLLPLSNEEAVRSSTLESFPDPEVAVPVAGSDSPLDAVSSPLKLPVVLVNPPFAVNAPVSVLAPVTPNVPPKLPFPEAVTLPVTP